MIKVIKRSKQNPTDHNLISKLTVKKSFPGYGTMYEVYLGKKRIGFADIDKGKTEISFVHINEEYRRKGVSTFLYDYIEKDLGRSLKPSEDLIEDGQAFWKNRSRRSNPENEKLLKTLNIRKIIPNDLKKINYEEFNYFYIDKGDILYLVQNSNYNKLGFAIYDNRYGHIKTVFILEDYQRQGVASFLYDYIEKDLGHKLKPSKILLSDGKSFWKSRLKKK